MDTTITAITPFSSLPEENQALFKIPEDEQQKYFVIQTESTIFHPQGGGQPSDVGTLTGAENGVKFDVISARTDAIDPDQVLHCGHYFEESASSPSIFNVGDAVTQAIDVEKRLLYSRYHTAGHVLGAAVRHLLEKTVPNFDELKANHFPSAAACEFKGLIDGKHKDAIQTKVDEYVDKAMDVEIDWWDADDFKKNGVERLIPEGPVPKGGKWRVVNIVGAEVYPCGGTHVDTTKECGKTTVTKIKRQKGVSRVSYNVPE